MEIHPLDRANLIRAYGIESQRLLPWAALNAPFEGAWCIVPPGGVSTAHAHHEYEIFIAVAGRGTLVADGERRPFAAGDIAFLPPGCTHHVVNDELVDFEFYGIWWDAAVSVSFLARDREAAR
jgi:mannose-6-phosphate isomerase-like protein (cupin superfamily)